MVWKRLNWAGYYWKMNNRNLFCWAYLVRVVQYGVLALSLRAQPCSCRSWISLISEYQGGEHLPRMTDAATIRWHSRYRCYLTQYRHRGKVYILAITAWCVCVSGILTLFKLSGLVMMTRCCGLA